MDMISRRTVRKRRKLFCQREHSLSVRRNYDFAVLNDSLNFEAVDPLNFHIISPLKNRFTLPSQLHCSKHYCNYHSDRVPFSVGLRVE